MTERSRILTVLTNSTYSIAREVVFEAVAMAEAVDEDEAIKATSSVRKIVRINYNACPKKNISIAKTITSTLIMAVLVTLEVTIGYLSTPSVTSRRTRTTRRKPSQLKVTARIEARNDLIPK